MSQESPGFDQAADKQIEDILDQLTSGRVDSGWTAFLRRYSSQILRVVRQFEDDPEQLNDCFLYACAQLSDNEFRRLLAFRRDGPAKFSTWLSTVVANLCIDWRRQQHGRFRPIAAIARLPELDQLIYRCIFARGMTRDQCLHALAPRFPDLTAGHVSEINTRLFSLLSSRQRWQLGSRSHRSVSLDEALSADPEDPGMQPEDPGPGPDVLVQMEQDRVLFETAMAQLEPRQRLLLRLRYLQDLTLEEVARLVGLPDPYRANREIQAALAALARIVKPETS